MFFLDFQHFVPGIPSNKLVLHRDLHHAAMGEVWCASNLRHLSVPHASLRRLLAPENARGAVAQRPN